MLVKIFSVVNLICALAILSLNIKDGTDPMFFIVAGGIGANIGRIILATVMVVGAFFSMPKKWHPEPELLMLGFALVAFGVSGFILNSFNFALYSYIKPLDFLMIAEAGIVSSLVALEAHKPMFHFQEVHKRTFSVPFLPHFKKIKPATA
jgi:predicted ABC-type sugar transport system permease subunit